jgi:D-glycero-D-manno-heptose 1,7-bisphosphate phosphatase
MQGGVFIDRDGTLNEEVGYINHIDRFRLYPWSAAAIAKLNRARIPVVVVTNQAGLARGFFTERLLAEVHEKMKAELARSGAHVDAIYYCPHHPEAKVPAYRMSCACRKPAPGMLVRASEDLHLNLQASFVVSDRYQDVAMGMKAGAMGILVLTGYGKGEALYQQSAWPRPPDCTAADLMAAVNWILVQTGNGDEIGTVR